MLCVDTRGQTGHIQPRCSHPEFCASATAALEAVRFMPARRDGRIIPRHKIVYPPELCIDGMPELIHDLTSLRECVDPGIS